jgi:glutathione S-transferase
MIGEGPANTRPSVTVFAASPDQGRGLARDMTVRWALEELGRDYDIKPVPMVKLKSRDHLALQPFGQIPAYQDGALAMFESGAIVLHLAQHDERLLPSEPADRALTAAWIFAAVSTVEPVIVHLETALRAYAGETWQAEAIRPLRDLLNLRLCALENHLKHREWLGEQFSGADILMIQALRRLDATGLLSPYLRLSVYIEQGTARPAFKRAFAAQLKTWEETTDVAPTGD